MNHNRVRFRFIDPNPESAQSINGSQTIIAHEKSVQPTNPVGKSGNNGGAMRNALVTRHSNFRIDVRCSFNPKFHAFRIPSHPNLGGSIMPTSGALVQPWQAVLWDQLLDNCADCLAS